MTSAVKDLSAITREHPLSRVWRTRIAGDFALRAEPRFSMGRPEEEFVPRVLAGQHDPQPYDVRNADGSAECIIVCDHASNRIPKSLGNLGVEQAELQRHIAIDIGSEDVGVHMSKALDAPAIFATYSRLVVDLNRGILQPNQIPTVSDKTHIGGNVVTHKRMRARIDEIFIPYHQRLSRMIDETTNLGKVPVLVFVHSCTPEMNGVKRPWEIAVLWNKDEQLAKRYIEALRRDNPDFNIGDNKPYSLKDPMPGSSIERHAIANGLPHLVLEFRQDLVDTPEKARRMADIALRSLKPIIDDKATHQLICEPMSKVDRKMVHEVVPLMSFMKVDRPASKLGLTYSEW